MVLLTAITASRLKPVTIRVTASSTMESDMCCSLVTHVSSLVDVPTRRSNNSYWLSVGAEPQPIAHEMRPATPPALPVGWFFMHRVLHKWG